MAIMPVAMMEPYRDLREAFWSYMRRRGFTAANTIRTYWAVVNKWLNWCNENGINPLTATVDDVIDWRDHMLAEEGLLPTTAHHRITVLKIFYSQLMADGLVAHNPARTVKVPFSKQSYLAPARALTEEELQRLFAAVKGDNLWAWRDRAILGLLAIHGLRQIEVINMQVRDYWPTEAPYVIARGKGQERIVFLREDTELALMEWLARREAEVGKPQPTDPMFIRDRGHGAYKGLTSRGLNWVIRQYLDAAGLHEHRPHDLRHTAATLALKHGAEERAVQEELGHRNPRTTQIYAHYVNAAENNPAKHIPVAIVG